MAKKARSRSSRVVPQDILFYNILPRLPGKSLLRFMRVSKQWHSFLKTPLFAQMQLHHATNNYHQNILKFLGFSTKKPNIFYTIDCEAPKDGLISSLPLPFKASPHNRTILASFGGLVCVGITKRGSLTKYSDMILWNPLTGDYKTLSKTNSHKNCDQTAFGLYYSSCDDDFKLLRICYDLNAYIYSLKSDAWKKVDSTKDLKRIAAYPCRPFCLWPSVALNEKLYFLTLGQDSTRSSIIRFDTKTEKFTEIATPCLHLFTEIAHQEDVFLSFIVLKGCIHFFVTYCSNSLSPKSLQNVDCWWMDADGKWIKEVTLPKASYIIIEPLHALDEEKQLTGSSCDIKAWKLDLTSQMIIDITWSYSPDRSIYIPPQRGKYMETLVSPNRR